MAKDVDLSSDEWRDLVFEGKNKEFGAYELRGKSPKRHNFAMIAVVVFILALFGVSWGVSKVLEVTEAPKETNKENIVTDYVDDVIEEEIEEEQQMIELPPEETLPPEEVLNTEKATEIVILPDDQVTEPPRSQDELQNSTTAVGVVDQTGGTDDIIDAKAHEDVVVVETTPPPPPADDNKVWESVEQDPQFPGGQEALLKWVADHLRYPSVAQENGIQGRVVVQFVVTKTGAVGQVKVVRGKDPDLDKEAVRVVKALPKFTPGKMNGHPVNVWYTLPITFKLQGL